MRLAVCSEGALDMQSCDVAIQQGPTLGSAAPLPANCLVVWCILLSTTCRFPPSRCRNPNHSSPCASRHLSFPLFLLLCCPCPSLHPFHSLHHDRSAALAPSTSQIFKDKVPMPLPPHLSPQELLETLKVELPRYASFQDACAAVAQIEAAAAAAAAQGLQPIDEESEDEGGAGSDDGGGSDGSDDEEEGAAEAEGGGDEDGEARCAGSGPHGRAGEVCGED